MDRDPIRPGVFGRVGDRLADQTDDPLPTPSGLGTERPLRIIRIVDGDVPVEHPGTGRHDDVGHT